MRTRVVLNILRWLHQLVTCRVLGIHSYRTRRMPVNGYRPSTFVVARGTCRRCECSPTRWAAGALVRA